MRFLHLADLHIGKKVNGYSMIEDQAHVLAQILAYVAEKKPQAVLLCGDVYDKPQPTEDAVRLFDGFLTRLAELAQAVLIIPGNHDSAERLCFAADMLKRQGVYLARPFGGQVEVVQLADEAGPVNFWLLPFVKPVQVRRCFEDVESLATYDEAVARIMQEVKLPEAERNVLLAHQFLTGAAVCESEELAIGGLDNVSAGHFAAFDYVALGHLHGAQQVERAEVRYAGSPLKYSFSEARQKKSVALVDMDEAGRVTQELLQLKPLRDMREISGKFAEILEMAPSDDYMHITLTDEEDVINAPARLAQVFPNLMKLDQERTASRESRAQEPNVVLGRGPLALFAEFYSGQSGRELNEQQRALLRELAEEIWEQELEMGEEAER